MIYYNNTNREGTIMKRYLNYFLLFAKIGASTFGGGYAMLPILQHELVKKRGWLSEEELADCFALAQCQPGIIFVNTITLIMRPRFGPLAAIVSVFSAALPSLLIILLIALLLTQVATLKIVQHAFAGIRVAVAAILVYSAWRLIKSGVKDVAGGMLYAVAFVLLFLGVNPVFIILGAAGVGVAYRTLLARRKGGA